MLRHITKSLLITAAILIVTSSVADADLVFNFSPSSTGGTVVEIIGTGQVLNGGTIGFGYDGASLIMDPNVTQSQGTDAAGLGIMLDGQAINSFIVDTFSNPVFSQIELTFDGNIGVGAELSDLNGVYTFDDMDFQFDGFNPGQYVLNYAYGINVGSVAVNVSAVPEPSGLSLFSLTLLVHAIRRRKRS